MRLANWYFLILIPLVVYLFLKKNKIASLKFSSIKLLKNAGMKKTIKHRIGRLLIMLSMVLLVIALARPQLPENALPLKNKGVDMAILLDVSGSMQSVDFKPNRLEAAKSTVWNFVKQRPTDRTALVIFAGTAYTRVPLTLDHNVFEESLKLISSKSVNEDGTAIGMAISVGLNRLKKSEARSKIMILATDGDNNAGEIDPETAGELAKKLGIKIYTIGIGTNETIIPVDVLGQTQYQKVEGGLNEKLLKKIAGLTGGKYFRAKDSKAMSGIFSNINRLEKTEFKQDDFIQYKELAFLLIKIALALLAVGIFLDKYYFVQVP